MKMNNQRLIFGVAILLLVVGAATTLDIGEFAQLDYEHMERFYFGKSRWTVNDCIKMRDNLPEEIQFALEPTEMTQRLADLIQTPDPSKKLMHYYASTLIAYATLNRGIYCTGIDVNALLAITSICKSLRELDSVVNFLEHHAPKKIKLCTLEILERLDKKADQKLVILLSKWNEFFAAGLGIESNSLSNEEMDEHLRGVDLAEVELNVQAMTKVIGVPPHRSLEKLFDFLRKQCASYRDLTFGKAQIVNVARGIEVVQEDELTSNFRLINKYVHFCAQYLNEEASRPIKTRWRQIISTKAS